MTTLSIAQESSGYAAAGLVWKHTNADGAKNYLWSVVPSDPTKGPFVVAVGDHDWNGTIDSCLYVGYNIGPGGTPIVASEPYFGFVIEQDYFVGGQHLLEAYFEWRGPTTHTRPIMFGWDKGSEHDFGISMQTPNIQRVAVENSSTVINAWTESELWMKSQRLVFGDIYESAFNSWIEAHTSSTNGITLGCWNAYTSGQYARLAFTRSESSTVGTHQALHQNNGIGAIEFWGSDGAQFVNAAYINAVSDAQASAGKVPTRITMGTMDDAGALNERFRLDKVGALTLSALAGSGSRAVVVDANGKLSAP